MEQNNMLAEKLLLTHYKFQPESRNLIYYATPVCDLFTTRLYYRALKRIVCDLIDLAITIVFTVATWTGLVTARWQCCVWPMTMETTHENSLISGSFKGTKILRLV